MNKNIWLDVDNRRERDMLTTISVISERSRRTRAQHADLARERGIPNVLYEPTGGCNCEHCRRFPITRSAAA